MKPKRAEFSDDAVVLGPDRRLSKRRSTPKRRPTLAARMPKGRGKFEGQVVIVTGAAGSQGEIRRPR